MAFDKQIPLRMPLKLYKRAERAAAKKGVSVSELIRESLEQRLSKPCARCHGTGVD